VEPRSGCPVNAAVEVLGDRWSLLVLRDVMFEDRRFFRALLIGSPEGIASNILADRLVRLVDAGLLTRGTGARGQRIRYALTEAGIQTLPVICALGTWGLDWGLDSGLDQGLDRRPTGGGLRRRLQLLRDEGPVFVQEVMDELRARHLGGPPLTSDGPSPLERLDAAAGPVAS
jgi:DNA-binding HxlR family transcriptional regulator